MAPGGDVMPWPGFTFDYWRRIRRVRPSAHDTRALAHNLRMPSESISSFGAAI